MKRLSTPSVSGGIVLIVLGLLFFLITQGSFSLNWGNAWPLFVIVPGVVTLAGALGGANSRARRAATISGTLLLLLGVFFLAITLELVSWNGHGILWPIYLIILGLALCAGHLASGTESTNLLWFGGALLLLGGLFQVGILSGLLYNLHWDVFDGRFDQFTWMATWWPLTLLLPGVLLLGSSIFRSSAGSRQTLATVGTLILLLGLFFQLTTLGIFSWGSQGTLWPLYLVIIGLAMLVGRYAGEVSGSGD